MKTTIGRKGWLVLLALVFAFATGSAVWAKPAQGYGQGQQNPPKPPAQPVQPGQPGTQPPASAPPVNAEEEAAYKAFFETRGNPQHKIELGEEFLKKFPESRYREGVYSALATAYASTGHPDKILAAGGKALELNPDDVDVLSLMALVMPRTVNPGSLDADQKLQSSEKYSKRAISLLTALPKPAGMTDEDFARAKNEKLSMCHSGLGLVYYHRQRFVDSVSEFEQATKLIPNPDPTDYFLLGWAYQQAKRYSDAATAFGHCGETPWPWQERCKKGMEDAKKLAATQPAPPKQ